MKRGPLCQLIGCYPVARLMWRERTMTCKCIAAVTVGKPRKRAEQAAGV